MSKPNTRTRLVIMAKAPLPGYAKTRLIPALGEQGSAQLAQHLLQHTLTEALAAGIGPVELCVSPSVHHPIWPTLALPALVTLSEQGGGDLGQRLNRVVHRATAAGEAILLIGTDCPGLNRDHLQAAAHALDSHDTCLTPVSDGGYALLGLRQPLDSLFTNMPWSTAAVAQLSRERILADQRTLAEQPMLHDIDEPDDLRHLPSHWLVTEALNAC
ncbi:TIGR04282 family arsenosugar biosynthesis glycosyltransferase [Oceanobacter sp. 5_MG-2023]|uniref:TIGR04282 family arsenosugar biosynthesis glycosyltransferase n=1 Tax=Oceanobacter sp. 5_MG-2023 TaxID=3062645 RepID=UPI0026E1AB88|nr:TIGR04282 family arsenosugar biosynthesis glycosyltransferase [Oceanobacter sp. 5_MG-2023]MDO6680886.1 TIGR04282 family arsenosugar biosynthesis glycosyltransferase [Oceanobacter sp. 5_MG-2023]